MMLEKFLLWAIHQLNFVYKRSNRTKTLLSASYKPPLPEALPSPQYLMRQCLQLGPAKDGFSQATGCGKTDQADSRNCHIYILLSHAELSCIRDYCRFCRKVSYRFEPSAEEVSELAQFGVSITNLTHTPTEFVAAFFFNLGRWPESYQAFGQAELTVASLPEYLRLGRAE